MEVCEMKAKINGRRFKVTQKGKYTERRPKAIQRESKWMKGNSNQGSIKVNVKREVYEKKAKLNERRVKVNERKIKG